jgi:hypothetical protein
MKVVKRIFKILFKTIFILIGVLIIAALILIGIDKYNTRYLSLDKTKPENTNTYIISNVNIIPMTKDTVLRNKMIYIKDGIINKIADTIAIENTTIIDAQNKYLTPGLIDMHVHVWDKYELGLYLANGVTAVRNVWGMPMHLRMKAKATEENIYAPSFFTSGPKLTGPEFIGDDNLQLFTSQEAKNKVQTYKEKGYDFIKTYYGMTPKLFDAIIATADSLNMDIVAHPSQNVPYSYHFKPQIKSIEHAEDIVQQQLKYELDTLKLKNVIELYRTSKNTAFCPTITVYNNIYQMLINDTILNSEDLKLMNPLVKKLDSQAQFDRWQNTKSENAAIVKDIKAQHDFHLKIIKDLNNAGATIISGTDAGIGITIPGESLHKELQFYKEAGLSNYEILKTATVNAANTHKIMNNLGTIEVNKTANLLLLNENPLENLSTLKNPEMIFIKGRKLNHEKLNTFKEKAKDRNNMIVTGFRYLENMMVEK